MENSEKLESVVRERFGFPAAEKTKQAIGLTRRLLEGRKRYDGKDFIEHSIAVALIVAEDIGLGMDSVLASVLHDVSRLGLLPDAEIEREFGRPVREVLDGMNSISRVETNTDSKQAEYFKDLIVSLSSNPRVILIKLADRLEVMRSIGSFPSAKRSKKSWETLHIYSQIAHKLGLYNLKSEMEDLSLKYLEPEEYAEIERKLTETKSEREDFITQFIAPIRAGLDKRGVKYNIKGRTKSIYSIWRKMKKQQVAFEDVYDVFAIRIVIDCPLEEEKSLCWFTYSLVTDFYKPNPQRMRDWISIPKSNGYESLHATVVTPEGKWVEVQIRTKRMDETAECGIAAHWRYKGVKEDESGQEWLEKLRGILDSMDISDGSLVFSGDIEQTSKEVFAFTPNGDLRKLSKGATILDFAYDIHTDIGNTCVGGRINHRNATIRDEIKSGDLVEILTSKNQRPRRDWLNIVRTSKAKSRIRAYLREIESKEANAGREELERKLKNWKLNIELEDSTNYLCKYYKVKSALEVYSMIAEEKLSLPDIKEILNDYVQARSGAKQEEKPETKEPAKTAAPAKPGKDTLIVGNNLNDVQYKFAKCCNPIFGDDIFGFVTVLNGITVHRSDCPNGKRLKEQYPYRVIDAQWQGEAWEQPSVVRISVVSDDVMGLEYSIKEVLKTLSVELRGIATDYSKGTVESVVTIGVSSRNVVDSVIYLLKQISGVKKVLLYK